MNYLKPYNDAKRAGDEHYMPKNPCRYCNTREKRLNDNNCVECQRLRRVERQRTKSEIMQESANKLRDERQRLKAMYVRRLDWKQAMKSVRYEDVQWI